MLAPTVQPRNLGFVTALFKRKRAGQEGALDEEDDNINLYNITDGTNSMVNCNYVNRQERENCSTRNTPMKSPSGPKRIKPIQQKLPTDSRNFIPLSPSFSDILNEPPRQKCSSEEIEFSVMRQTSYEADGLASRSLSDRRAFFRALGEGVLTLSEAAQPSKEEGGLRDELIQRISAIVADLSPDAEVHLFGSWKTGLCLSESDIDLLILNFNIPQPEDGYWQPPLIRILAEAIDRLEAPKELKVIDSAQVPIIKMVDSKTDLKLDISLDTISGLSNTKIVLNFVQELPMLKPLVLAIKYYLKQESMNETYQGGLGSYLLVLLIVSVIQIHARKKQHIKSLRKDKEEEEEEGRDQCEDVLDGTTGDRGIHWDRVLPESKEEELGLLFADFFRIYGINFNYDNVAVSVNGSGALLDKESAYPLSLPGFLAIRDPDSGNDVGNGCWNIVVVKEFFKSTFLRLLSAENVEAALSPATVNPLRCLIKKQHLLLPRAAPLVVAATPLSL